MSTLRERKIIFEKLRSGVVPECGLQEFAVGIDKQLAEIRRQLALAKDGSGGSKFFRGGYGCGKTFMARLTVLEAQSQGFATSFVVVSDNDFHIHKFDVLYRKVVQELATPSCARGALSDIIDRWIATVEEKLIAGGEDPNSSGFDSIVQKRLSDDISALTGGKAPEDLGRVLREVFKCKQEGKLREAGALLSWLSGSENVGAAEKRAAGIKGEITSSDAMAYLHGILEIVKAAGYKGLVIVIDEAETILRMRQDVRGKSLNGIRQIVDGADRFKGLLWVFTGTPEFFDSRRGVAGLQPLHDRLQFLTTDGIVTTRQPQLELKPFDAKRLLDVGMRLRELYPDWPSGTAAESVSKESIESMVKEVTAGFAGDVGVVPRQFLRRLVNRFDVAADNPEALVNNEKVIIEPTPAELRAEKGLKPVDYEPEPGDDKGYEVSAVVEF